VTFKIEGKIKNSLVSSSKKYHQVQAVLETPLVLVKDQKQISVINANTGKIIKITDCVQSQETRRNVMLEIKVNKNELKIYTLERKLETISEIKMY
jgi:hypothetical protein